MSDVAAPDALSAIRRTFFQECEEQLAELEAGLLAMQTGDPAADTVHAIFRAVHSIKGGAGAFALDDLVGFAHGFETALDAIRSGRLAVDAAALRLFLRASDVLADLVRAADRGADVDPVRSAALLGELLSLTAAPPAQEGRDAFADFKPVPVTHLVQALWRIRFRPHAAFYSRGNDPILLLRELSRLGQARISLDADALPNLAALEPESAYLSWTVELTTDGGEADIRDVFEFVDGDCDLDIAVVPPDPARTLPDVAGPEPARPTTIRVDLARLDRLIDLVGELVITQSTLRKHRAEADRERCGTGLDALEHLTRDIQDGVMAIRAQPVRSVFQRMPRLAREVAAHTGKLVRLVVEGEATEVDTTVIERLSDPLIHMVRNAIDHGIETPKRRIAMGKPAEGVVRLAAVHRAGRIVIDVSDDGGGIDRARVLASATAKGLVPPGAKPTDADIDDLLFAPGFSTVAVPSDISGRGVGMDVVRRGIQALGGRITISSVPGCGSTFSLSLPLTLAVLDGMVVGVDGTHLVVPLGSILQTFRPEIIDAQAPPSASRIVRVQGAYTRLIDLGAILGLCEAVDRPSAVALLIEAEDGRRAGLLVDAVEGQRHVVMKSLDANYRPVDGIAAATILGDGSVALIVDVAAIIDAAEGPLGAGRLAMPQRGCGTGLP